MPSRGRVTPYMLAWMCVLLLFAGGVWWAVEHAPTAPIDPDKFTSKASVTNEESSATIDETLGATDIVTKDAAWTVNGDDGKITLVASVQDGVKQRSNYSISNGRLTFLLKSKQTGTDKEQLVINLANATYSKEAGLVHVKGTLKGDIAAGGHHFLAEEMSWDQSQKLVTTKEISYRGPGISVTGKDMSINLETGEVRFAGPVDVGI
jgi:hypothetical protein